MLVAVPLGELPFFYFGAKTSERYLFKGLYFSLKSKGQNIEIDFFKENFYLLFNCLYYALKNQILHT